MPSSPNYVRNYRREAQTAKARGEDKDSAQRHRARYQLEKEGLVKPNDGKDVGHIKAVGKGGTNARSNLEVQTVSQNRSFARNKDGSMKSETSKKERAK